MNAADVETFRRCISVGGVALFPADTVYGLATEPHSREGVDRIYGLKGRRAERPSAVMFFGLELALAALPEIGEETARALGRLLPGRSPPCSATALDGSRSPAEPEPERLGLRVPCSRASSPRFATPAGPCFRRARTRAELLRQRPWPPWTRGFGAAWT